MQDVVAQIGGKSRRAKNEFLGKKCFFPESSWPKVGKNYPWIIH